MTSIKWQVELLRLGITVISVVVAVVIFGTSIEKQVALNQLAISMNQEDIKKIMDNHLPHIQMSIDEIKETVYEIKTLIQK